MWGWFVGIGAALAALGFIASANLFLATMAATYIAGSMMFAGGILQLVHAVGVRRWTWVALWTLSGLLYLSASVAVLYNPAFAASLLTLLLGYALGASGLVRSVVSIGWRGNGWGWLLLSGLISLSVAAIILFGWPANSFWVLGMFLAIDLLMQGVMLMSVGFALRPRVAR
ncbi:HdeD family acid-resistance protein [Sphingobium nicotianae]|uniref:HdeD family acid-resistance protein n=1 Tax=Sphingobium nicotianae TaxID=2782607 RepID=UPI003D7E06F7